MQTIPQVKPWRVTIRVDGKLIGSTTIETINRRFARALALESFRAAWSGADFARILSNPRVKITVSRVLRFETCPHCDARFKAESFNAQAWIRSHVRTCSTTKG